MPFSNGKTHFLSLLVSPPFPFTSQDMGAIRSKEYKAAQERSKKLDQVVRNYHQMDQKKIKLLLLGAGESGKSTIFKQMKYIYGNPYPLKEREHLVSVVHSNILTNMRLLVEATFKFTPLANAEFKPKLDSVPLDDDTVIDSQVGELLKQIWLDSGVQDTWQRHRSDFQVQDALGWYMCDIDRISAANYVPSVDDIFRARVRTSGIVEETFHIDKIEFVMYDVGGQRNERKKWNHLFDSVTAVIFCVAINEYDQMLYESETTPRMDESLILWDETCNLKHFDRTSMILFMNKADLFRQKLKSVPVRVVDGANPRYEDFKGPYVDTPGADFQKCYDAAVDYFLQLFLRRNHNPNREVYWHVTCATDTDNVRVVFAACKHIILSNHLTASGFML